MPDADTDELEASKIVVSWWDHQVDEILVLGFLAADVEWIPQAEK